MPDSLPCPECGKDRLTLTVETCRLQDGLTVKNLRHYKCSACGARLFDDEAIHRIQHERAARSVV